MILSRAVAQRFAFLGLGWGPEGTLSRDNPRVSVVRLRLAAASDQDKTTIGLFRCGKIKQE